MPEHASTPIASVTSRLLASQWAETLRQTACLEVLLEHQARTLAHLTGQEPTIAIRLAHEQVEAVFYRLLHQNGYADLVNAGPGDPAVPKPKTPAHPLADEAFDDE